MRKTKIACVLFLLGVLAGCGTPKSESSELSTIYKMDYEVTEAGENVSYEVEDVSYDYLMTLEGRSPNAVCDSYYKILTNNEALEFEDVDEDFWSSDSKDRSYVIVEFGTCE